MIKLNRLECTVRRKQRGIVVHCFSLSDGELEGHIGTIWKNMIGHSGVLIVEVRQENSGTTLEGSTNINAAISMSLNAVMRKPQTMQREKFEKLLKGVLDALKDAAKNMVKKPPPPPTAKKSAKKPAAKKRAKK